MKHFLSNWISNHSVLSEDPSICKSLNDEKYGIDQVIINNLAKMGIKQLFPGRLISKICIDCFILVCFNLIKCYLLFDAAW